MQSIAGAGGGDWGVYFRFIFLLFLILYRRERTKQGAILRIFMRGPRNIYERFMSEKKTTRLAHNFFYEQVASKIVRTFYEHIMSKVRVSESEKKEG